jgi:hypothetical protein
MIMTTYATYAIEHEGQSFGANMTSGRPFEAGIFHGVLHFDPIPVCSENDERAMNFRISAKSSGLKDYGRVTGGKDARYILLLNCNFFEERGHPPHVITLYSCAIRMKWVSMPHVLIVY